MKQLDAAILTALEGDAAIVAAAPGGVWKRRAPEGSLLPIVVFFESAGTATYTFTQRKWTEYVYVVKAVCDGDDNEPVCDLDALIDARLSDGALEKVVLADGAGTIQSCRRETDVEYEEGDDPGRRFQHKGGTFRVFVIPS